MSEKKIKQAIDLALCEWEYIPIDTTQMVNYIYRKIKKFLVEEREK